MANKGMEQFDLVIVGAGFYGLQMAKTYLEVNPDCKLLVLDSQASIGGTWAEERLYEGLHTNNIVGTFGFSDYPLDPKEWGMEHEKYNPGAKVHAYFTAWAKKFGVFQRTRFNAVVESADLQADNTWIVSYLVDLVETQIATKKLVLATGTTWKPMIPPMQGADLFKGEIFHTKELAARGPDMAAAEHITVTGGSKSAADAVYMNATKGKKVNWIVRESGKGPTWMVQSYATPFKFWFEKLTLTRLLTWFAPTPYTDSYPWARWFLHNTWLGRKVNAALWWLINDDVVASANFKTNPNTAKLQPRSSIYWWGIQVGIFNYPTDIFELIRNGTIEVHVADIESLSEHKISLSNGTILESDMLICATGWHMTPTVQLSPPEVMAQVSPISHNPNDPKIQNIDRDILATYPMLKNQPSGNTSVEFEKPSYELYRGSIPPEFISTRNFAWNGMIPNLSGTTTAGIQALWITAFLDNKLETPPETLFTPEQIKQQVLYHARFWRWRSPMGLGTMMPDMVFEVLPFLDTLLRDLGLKTNRKGGWREILEPYGKQDYKGLVQEWLSKGKKVN